MFKKLFTILLLCILSAYLTACGGNETPQPTEPESVIETVIVEQVPEPPVEAEPEPLLPGKIAFVTMYRACGSGEEEYMAVRLAKAKYGEEYIIHRTWPIMFEQEGEMMITLLSEIAADPEVKVLILNWAVVNTNVAVDAFRALRDDVFIVYINPAEAGYSPAWVAHDGRHIAAVNHYKITTRNADLIFNTNNATLGYRFVNQAIAMGAETIVHYSFPRHMEVPHLAARRDRIKAAAEAAGIPFHDLPTPDPMEEGGMAASQLFVSQDVPRQVARFGENTAFFSTNCGQQIPLLTQILAYGAIYVMPCCPSPFHAFPTTLGLAADQSEALDMFSTAEIIEVTSAAIAERGMTGRISNIPMSYITLPTLVATEYGIRWMRGEVPKDEIDLEVLSQIMADIIAEQTEREGLGVQLARHEFDGEVFSNFILISQDFLVY